MQVEASGRIEKVTLSKNKDRPSDPDVAILIKVPLRTVDIAKLSAFIGQDADLLLDSPQLEMATDEDGLTLVAARR